MKRALIVGITGQDGAYLAQLLLGKGYQVHGTRRGASPTTCWRLEELGIARHPHLNLIQYDITDPVAAVNLLESTAPDEVYNLAAQSHVDISFDQPGPTTQVTAVGTLNLLEAIRSVNPRLRYFQASSSEMFGNAQAVPQDEATPFHPRSPYGVAKLYAHWISVNYREACGLFAAIGILFNHESPLRGREFVTRKVTDAVAKIALGKLDCIELGNLDAKRDRGYAREYVDGMWRMLQAERADTFVLASGRSESVRDFVSMAFRSIDVELDWRGAGDGEQGVCAKTGKVRVRVDPQLYRPADFDFLLGNATHARQSLSWSTTTTLEELSQMMVDADLERNRRGVSF